MRPKKITVSLSEIAGEVERETVDEAGPTDSTDLGQIVERTQGRLHIVDGFHRTAGQLRHCRESGIDPASLTITVVLGCANDNDNDLVSDASAPGPKQDAAIAEIYRLAGHN